MIKHIPFIPCLCAVVLMSGLSACSREFLDADPLSIYEPTTTFSTESGLKAAMAICDRTLKLNYAHDYNEMLSLATEYMFSELGAAAATDKSQLLVDVAHDLTPTSDQSTEDNLSRGNSIWYFWRQGWQGIMYSNTIIQYAPRVKGLDENIKNAYLGRAYFHRAWRYYNIYMQFGDVPLLTKVADVPKQSYYSCKRDAAFQMFIQDLEFAVEWVPEQSEMDEVGMINKGACKVLLIKYYLAVGEYQKAKDLCDDLINGGRYALITGNSFGTFYPGGEPQTWPITRNVIWDMHRAENKLIAANTEVIQGVVNRGSDKESFVKMLTMRILYPFYFNGQVQDVDGVQALQNYKRDNSNYDPKYDYMRALGRGIATWRTTWWYTHRLWEVNGVLDEGDLRHSSKVGNWVRMEDLKVNNRNSKHYGENLRLYNDEGKLLCTDTIRRWFDVPHYKLWLDDPVAEANISGSDGHRGAQTGGNSDWYLYRLAEVYLLRAEAKFYMNPADPTIAEDINIIRRRAGCQQLYSGPCTIGDIVNERARELYFEEFRNVELTRISLCLARSGKPDEWGNVYKLDTFDKQSGTDAEGGSYWYQRINHYGQYNKGVINVNASLSRINYTMDKKNIYWPIPEKAITSNTKGQLHQNYGYAGYDPNVKEWETWEEAVADQDVE